MASVPNGNVGPDGRLYVTADNFDAGTYGAAPYDPAAPFGSVAAMDRPLPSGDGGMSLMPGPEVEQMASKWGPGPTPGGPPAPRGPEVPAGGMSVDMTGADQMVPNAQSNAPVEIAPVTVQGSAPVAAPDPLEFMRRGQAPSTPEQHAIADTMGYKWQGGQRAREAIDPYWQNAQRAGLFDPTRANALERQGFEGQRDAQWQATGAQLLANDAEVEALQRREQQLDEMRQQAAAKERAMRDQVDRDRVEYEGLKREYQQAGKEQFLASVPNALSTMFGMLAIGLAAKGTRENLNATIASVNGGIDRQVQAMRAQTAAKGQDAENAYARFLKSYNNADQAEAATKSLLTERAQAEIDRMRQQSRDPLIQANGQQAIAELDAARKRYQAEMDVAAQGKTAQAWNLGQQARAASAGGYRAMTADEQRSRSMANAKLTGENLGNQKVTSEIQKNVAEAGAASGSNLKEFAPVLRENADINTKLSTVKLVRDQIANAGDGSFAGMGEAINPVTGEWRKDATDKFSGKALEEQAALDSVVDGYVNTMYGAANPEQKEDAKRTVMRGFSKKGVDASMAEMERNMGQRIKENNATVPLNVQLAYDARREETGAAPATVTQPGRVALPPGQFTR